MSIDSLLSKLEAAAEAGPADLHRLSELAELSLKLDGEIADAEQVLADLKRHKNKIDLALLPEAMLSANVSSFVCGNHTVTVKEDMTCSVPKERKDQIIELLRSDEFQASELISNVVTVDLGKGQDAKVAKLRAAVEKLGFQAVVGEDVKTPSLKALLARRRRDGKQDDLGFFGAHVVTKATIK